MRDQVSNTSKTVGHNTVLYILIFTCLDRRWEHKSFWTEWQQALPTVSKISCFTVCRVGVTVHNRRCPFTNETCSGVGGYISASSKVLCFRRPGF